MGILTPTSKLKRSAAKTIYQAEIDKMYASEIMKVTKKWKCEYVSMILKSNLK